MKKSLLEQLAMGNPIIQHPHITHHKPDKEGKMGTIRTIIFR